VVGVAHDQVEMQDLFEFERSGISGRGKVVGLFRATGSVPQCMDRLRGFGVHLPESIFHEIREVKE
jgi:pilus assembly protein CpaF